MRSTQEVAACTLTRIALTVNANITDAAGGTIELATHCTSVVCNGADNDNLTINANISASGGAGNILLWSAKDILHTGGAISNTGTGTIKFFAGVDRVTDSPAAATPTAG